MIELLYRSGLWLMDSKVLGTLSVGALLIRVGRGLDPDPEREAWIQQEAIASIESYKESTGTL